VLEVRAHAVESRAALVRAARRHQRRHGDVLDRGRRPRRRRPHRQRQRRGPGRRGRAGGNRRRAADPDALGMGAGAAGSGVGSRGGDAPQAIRGRRGNTAPGIATMPPMIDHIVRERADALVRTLLESVRIASVSLTGEGIADQVAFLTKRLKDWGFAVEVHPTASHPIVYAEIGPADARFTWLLYGHYDVYPADEKQEGWRTKPFEPVIEGDRIWGRGTGDNKGQHLAMLSAIALWRELHGELPIRIKAILEGDEETGSVPLPKFIEANRARLKADLCCYSDGPMFPDDQPVLLMGVRGNLGIEFAAKGAKRNLHSGNFGGVAPNPTLDLIHLLAEMVDRDGRLRVPGAGYA